jgi:hypothetical protein
LGYLSCESFREANTGLSDKRALSRSQQQETILSRFNRPETRQTGSSLRSLSLDTFNVNA